MARQVIFGVLARRGCVARSSFFTGAAFGASGPFETPSRAVPSGCSLAARESGVLSSSGHIISPSGVAHDEKPKRAMHGEIPSNGTPSRSRGSKVYFSMKPKDFGRKRALNGPFIVHNRHVNRTLAIAEAGLPRCKKRSETRTSPIFEN